MLMRLLRSSLRPYAGPLSIVLVLQLVQSIANLFLPSLNADIIDHGVAKGDTDYILRTGGRHAARLARPGRVRHGRRVLRCAGRHGDGPRRAGPRLRQGAGVLGPGGRLLRCAVAHHPHHQRRPAGPDGRAAQPDDDRRRAGDGHRRRDHGDARGRRALRRCCVVIVPVLLAVIALVISRMRPLFKLMQVARRLDQPRAARADPGHPGHPGLRARRRRAGAVRRGERRPAHRGARRRPPHGDHVPRRHAGDERLQRVDPVVRRAPRRRRRCRSAR